MRLVSKPADLDLDLPFLKASRKIALAGNLLTVTQSISYKDAVLPADQESAIAQAFHQLQSNLDTAFILAALAPAASASGNPPRRREIEQTNPRAAGVPGKG